MRLRVIEGTDTRDAIGRMRAELGQEAMIVAAQPVPGGVRVTAVLETPGDDLAALLAPADALRSRDEIAAALVHHGVPAQLRNELLASPGLPEGDDASLLLAQLLGRACRWEPLPGTRPLLLVGPHGAGKTAMIARLAVNAALHGTSPTVIGADGVRAGATTQLAMLLEPLGVTPRSVADPSELRREVQGQAGVCLIDTAGLNAFRGEELARLAEWIEASQAEPVLVMPAGLQVEDGCELAANFAALGVRRVLLTKLDTARRLGAVICTALSGFTIGGCSIGPAIGRGVLPVTPLGLARLILSRASAAQLGVPA